MTFLTEGKATLYFFSRSKKNLCVSGKNFVLRKEDSTIDQKIPALSVRDIVIFGENMIHSSVFSLARSYEIPMHFLGNGGKYIGSIRFDYSKNIILRHNQIQFREKREVRLEIAKVFVRAKIKHQEKLLEKLRLSPKQTLFSESFEKIEKLETLRGIEGSSAKQYFALWKKKGIIKNEQFSFPGRRKRPPQDEINALLGFCYTPLHSEIITQLEIAGLDPYFGFLHDHRFGHAALASDFVEIYRAVIDHFVIKAINRKEFEKDDFSCDEGGRYRLSSSGFEKFFPKWGQYIRYEDRQGEYSLVALIERDVRRFVRYLMEDEEQFEVFTWK
jgi:CRISPR-associated protein Cas1